MIDTTRSRRILIFRLFCGLGTGGKFGPNREGPKLRGPEDTSVPGMRRQ
jgi:hypothetical protein